MDGDRTAVFGALGWKRTGHDGRYVCFATCKEKRREVIAWSGQKRGGWGLVDVSVLRKKGDEDR